MAARLVLNYHDAQLYNSDVALFTHSQWLNDNAINFYFQFLYQTLCVSGDQSQQRDASDVLFVDPAVLSCMMLQCDDDDEYQELASGLQLQQKQLCFIPVNNNERFGGESSHWSLLVYHRATHSFEHFDSSSDCNTRAAKRIMSTFEKMLWLCAGSSEAGANAVADAVTFVNVRDAPQQRNGYDCGMYVLVVAEYLCRQHVMSLSGAKPLSSLQEFVTPERVTKTRLEMPALICRLQLEQKTSK